MSKNGTIVIVEDDDDQRSNYENLLRRRLYTVYAFATKTEALDHLRGHRPDLLILDEPSSGIDFSGQAQLYDLISQVRTQTGVAVLMISHDLHVVMAATDRVLCLNTHLCCAGTPDAISNDPAYRELFGIEAGQSLALYHHHHDHAHDLDGHVHKHGPDEHGEHSHE